MKTSNFFKSIAIAALSGFLGVNTFAQVITSLPTLKSLPADSVFTADTVSIKALMPYMVVPDPTIAAATSIYNASGFSWTISSGTLTQSNGITGLTASPVASGYYTEQTVWATMPITAQDITMSVTERSNPKFSATSGCAGNTRTLAIHVIDLPLTPTIAGADTAQGGCTASANYTVKFDFSSSTNKYPIYVSYTIKAYNISNALVGTPVSRIYKINGASDNIKIDKTELDGISTSGVKYVVTLDKVWDRISANALNRDNLGVDASALKAAIYILPTPKTGVIKHIKTL